MAFRNKYLPDQTTIPNLRFLSKWSNYQEIKQNGEPSLGVNLQ